MGEDYLGQELVGAERAGDFSNAFAGKLMTKSPTAFSGSRKEMMQLKGKKHIIKPC